MYETMFHATSRLKASAYAEREDRAWSASTKNEARVVRGISSYTFINIKVVTNIWNLQVQRTPLSPNHRDIRI